MRAVKSQDTSPELIVRKLLREIGAVGYRLQRTELPGKPDIAFVGRRKAIFVHGCFWHGHDCARGHRIPQSNAAYWIDKIARNKKRDMEHLKKLSEQGWTSLVIWECNLKKPADVQRRLATFLND